jgi:hypothetical protein
MSGQRVYTRRAVVALAGLVGAGHLLRVPPRTPPGRDKKTPTPTARITQTPIVAPTPAPPLPAPVATVTGGAGVLRVALAAYPGAAALVVTATPAGGGEPLVLEKEL